VDWDTISDVQGNPEIKALFHTEYKREGGHPDFVYWRKTFEALDIEEKTRNELIRQAMDRMMHPEKYGIEPQSEIETDTSRRVEMLIREEMELNEQPKIKHDEPRHRESTRTYGNIHHLHFEVPSEVYAIAEYRDRLDNATTMDEAEHIVSDYYKHQIEKSKRYLKENEEKPKKKHWWQ
jgi:hypothetical protein